MFIGTYIAGFLLSYESSSLVSQDLERLKSLKAKGDIFPGWPTYEYITSQPIQRVEVVPVVRTVFAFSLSGSSCFCF